MRGLGVDWVFPCSNADGAARNAAVVTEKTGVFDGVLGTIRFS